MLESFPLSGHCRETGRAKMSFTVSVFKQHDEDKKLVELHKTHTRRRAHTEELYLRR